RLLACLLSAEGGCTMRILLMALGMVMLLPATFQGRADTTETAAEQDAKETSQEKELAKLQGLWGTCYDPYEFSHANGDHLEARPLTEMVKTHRIRGNKWLIVDTDGKATGVEKTITLVVTANPKQIRLTHARKRGNGQPDEQVTQYGI